MSRLDARLRVLEQRHTPDQSAMYAAARERLEAKLLAMPAPDDPIEMSEAELQQFIAGTKAYLQERRAEGRIA